jgi:hypothetical protein
MHVGRTILIISVSNYTVVSIHVKIVLGIIKAVEGLGTVCLMAALD